MKFDQAAAGDAIKWFTGRQGGNAAAHAIAASNQNRT